MKLERIVRAKCEYPFREHLIEQCAEYTLENALIKNNDNSQHTHTHNRAFRMDGKERRMSTGKRTNHRPNK